MSGPKCDEIVLSKAEEEKLRRFYEEQLQRERELLCRKREEERRERLRLQEEEKRRREEEKRRREEEQKKKQQDYRDGLSEYMSKLQEMEREQDADREEFDEAFEIYMAACVVAGENPRTFVYEPGVGKELADKLRSDGFTAEPYHGRMDVAQKRAAQEAFIRDEIRIIVATSAFGMGVDKPDVKLVVHYDISGSLENYVQEAGRDESLSAECVILSAPFQIPAGICRSGRGCALRAAGKLPQLPLHCGVCQCVCPADTAKVR